MRLKQSDYNPGRYYHFYNRGMHQLPIFRELDNYIFVVNKLKQYCLDFDITPIAYCLLPNHYHLLLRQNANTQASLVPQRMFNSYTKAYNKRYGHSGTLFQGSFAVKPVDNERYLVHLCRYIHGNPLKHGLVDSLDKWPYSNFSEWVRKRNGTLVDHQFINEYFSDRQDYADDVRAYALGQHHWPNAMSPYFHD